MKKEYMKPTMCVVELQHQCHILVGSNLSNLDTNLAEDDDLIFGGGGVIDAR